MRLPLTYTHYRLSGVFLLYTSTSVTPPSFPLRFSIIFNLLYFTCHFHTSHFSILLQVYRLNFFLSSVCFSYPAMQRYLKYFSFCFTIFTITFHLFFSSCFKHFTLPYTHLVHYISLSTYFLPFFFVHQLVYLILCQSSPFFLASHCVFSAHQRILGHSSVLA